MISDNKNDTADPHKIFRWPDDTGPKTISPLSPDEPSPVFEEYPLPTPESQPPLVCFPHKVYPDPADSHDILQECLKQLNIEGFEPPPEQQHCVEMDVIGVNVPRGPPQYPVGDEGAVHGAGLPGQPAQPVEAAVGGAYDEQFKQFLRTVTRTSDGSHFNTQFKVKVFYRGKMVSEQLIENESGVRLVYRPHMLSPAVDPESGLSFVSLPSPEYMADQTQARLTQKLLDSLGSLDVGVSGHVVYGQRRGETRAYWSFSNFDQSRQPRSVSKEPQQLYAFGDYMKGIIDFIHGKKDQRRPPCSLFFCLGEKWPDPDNKPWNKRLIMVEVVLTSMEFLNQMAVEGGASSLQSVELQMSLEEMMELY